MVLTQKVILLTGTFLVKTFKRHTDVFHILSSFSSVPCTATGCYKAALAPSIGSYLFLV